MPAGHAKQTIEKLNEIIKEDTAVLNNLISVTRSVQLKPIVQVTSILRKVMKKKIEDEKVLDTLFNILSSWKNVHIVRNTKYFSLDCWFKYDPINQTEDEMAPQFETLVEQNIVPHNYDVEVITTPEHLLDRGCVSASVKANCGIVPVTRFDRTTEDIETFYGEKIIVKI